MKLKVGFFFLLLIIILLIGSIWRITIDNSFRKGYRDGYKKAYRKWLQEREDNGEG